MVHVHVHAAVMAEWMESANSWVSAQVYLCWTSNMANVQCCYSVNFYVVMLVSWLVDNFTSCVQWRNTTPSCGSKFLLLSTYNTPERILYNAVTLLAVYSIVSWYHYTCTCTCTHVQKPCYNGCLCTLECFVDLQCQHQPVASSPGHTQHFKSRCGLGMRPYTQPVKLMVCVWLTIFFHK